MNEGSLRASDADRDQVAELLHVAFAEGRISYEEHAERMEATLRAKTFDDLRRLTLDLVAVWPSERGGYHQPAAMMSPAGAVDEPDRMTAALSEVKRVGRWRVRRQSIANTFLGSLQLDLTDATFDAPVVELSATQFMGSLFLRVPAGTTIRDETTRVMGSTSIKHIGKPDPSYPTIVLRGTNVMSEIKVRGPKRPSIWRKALA